MIGFILLMCVVLTRVRDCQWSTYMGVLQTIKEYMRGNVLTFGSICNLLLWEIIFPVLEAAPGEFDCPRWRVEAATPTGKPIGEITIVTKATTNAPMQKAPPAFLFMRPNILSDPLAERVAPVPIFFPGFVFIRPFLRDLRERCLACQLAMIVSTYHVCLSTGLSVIELNNADLCDETMARNSIVSLSIIPLRAGKSVMRGEGRPPRMDIRNQEHNLVCALATCYCG